MLGASLSLIFPNNSALSFVNCSFLTSHWLAVSSSLSLLLLSCNNLLCLLPVFILSQQDLPKMQIKSCHFSASNPCNTPPRPQIYSKVLHIDYKGLPWSRLAYDFQSSFIPHHTPLHPQHSRTYSASITQKVPLCLCSCSEHTPSIYSTQLSPCWTPHPFRLNSGSPLGG